MKNIKGKYTFLLSTDVYEYYKVMADRSGVSLSDLIEAYLRHCMEEGVSIDHRRVADLTVGELLNIIAKRDRKEAEWQAEQDEDEGID